MSVLVVDRYAKPAPWIWSPGSLADDWSWVPVGLRSIHAFWRESPSFTRDIFSNRMTGTIPSAWTWQPTRRGIALRAASMYESIALTGPTSNPSTDAITVVAVIDNASTAYTTNILLGLYSGGNGWTLRPEQYDAPGKVGVTKTGFTGGNGDLASSFDTPTGPAVVGMTMSPADSWIPYVWLNGVKEALSGGSSSAAPNLAITPTIGEAASGGSYLDVLAVYIWKRVLPDKFMQQIALNPFGPMRMDVMKVIRNDLLPPGAETPVDSSALCPMEFLLTVRKSN